MRIIQKQVDEEYLRYFDSYCESLSSISNDEWNYHIVSESIAYIQDFFFSEYHLNGVVPERFEKSEYLFEEENSHMIPPACRWISKSGRYSCHFLDDLIGGQASILWDLKRRVVLPLIFHDLEGIDEQEGVIFGRTMSPIHRNGYCSPMTIDLDWINILNYCVSMPFNYHGDKEHSPSEEELFKIAGAGIARMKNEKDLFNNFKFPALVDLTRRNIQFLDQVDIIEKEKNNLASEILFHPHFREKSEDWVFDALFTFSEDMQKCKRIASYFDFEDVLDEAYVDWKQKKVNYKV